MKSRFPGKCACCGEAFAAGAEIDYDAASKSAYLPGHEAAESPAERAEREALADKLGFEEAK